MSPISFRLDGKEILGRPEGMRGIKLEVKTIFVTCLSQHIDDMEAVVLEAGVEVVDIIPAPIASSIIALSERQKTVGCAIIDIGAETTSITVFENNALIGMHTFSIGSADITNDIALGLKVSLDEAENLKINGITNSASSKRKLDDIIEARLSDIFELIEGYLRKIKRNGLLPAGVILCGGGTSLSIVEEAAKALLKLPVHIGAYEASIISKTKLRDPVWFISFGLCVLGKEQRIDRHIGSPADMSKKIKAYLSKWLEQFRP